MNARGKCVVAAWLLLFSGLAHAHRLDEYLQATMLSLHGGRVEASMRMLPGVLAASVVIRAIDANSDGVFSQNEEQVYARRVLQDLAVQIDGKDVQPRLVSWQFPQPSQLRDGVAEMHLEYAIDLPTGASERRLLLTNRHLRAASVYLVNVVVPEDNHLRILRQERSPQQNVYTLDFQQEPSSSAAEGRLQNLRVWMRGTQIASLFALGMRHIAEGTDHLLFLFTLLLPAPLSAALHRWGDPVSIRKSIMRMAAIVSAFTVGHSITLTLAALGLVRVPGRPVEVLIALSVFVSALHALRPMLPGREAWIAASFGLVHGLAFAATLDRLGLGRWERLLGILSFNLGIEAMQLIVVAAVLPSLLLLSRTRAYPMFRRCAAACAVALSLGWMAERMFGGASPADAVVDAVARHGALLAAVLLGCSLLCWFLLPLKRGTYVSHVTTNRETVTPTA